MTPLGGALLEIGLRTGERRLIPADRRVVDMLSGPIAVAVSVSTIAR